jgi:hypothetical protein
MTKIVVDPLIVEGMKNSMGRRHTIMSLECSMKFMERAKLNRLNKSFYVNGALKIARLTLL